MSIIKATVDKLLNPIKLHTKNSLYSIRKHSWGQEGKKDGKAEEQTE